MSKTGSGTAAGTAGARFRTLSEAAALLRPGDTCIVHEGVYRETMVIPRSGEPDRPIRVQAAPGARVVISATEPLNVSWTAQAGGVYVAKIDPPPAQLFFDGQMAREAHWPNGSYGDLMDRPCLKAEQGTGYEKIVCKGLPPGDFNGGYVEQRRRGPCGIWEKYSIQRASNCAININLRLVCNERENSNGAALKGRKANTSSRRG